MDAAKKFNVAPSDYASHLELAKQHNRDLWENNGWGIRSMTGPGDTLLWTAPYQLRSRPDGPFALDAASVLQTMYIHVDYGPEQKQQMNDNDFYAAGWNGPEDLRPVDDLSIHAGEDEAVWSIDGMRYVARPPLWEIHGNDHGVSCDLRLKASAPALWMTDPANTALETGDRWHLAYADVNGRLNLHGNEVPFSGMGWHERHVHLSTTYDPASLLRGQGITVHNGYSEDLQLLLLARPDLNVFRARVMTAEEVFDFNGAPSVRPRVEEHWFDPRSWFQIPCAWSIVLQNEKATLTLWVTGFARSYYVWSFLRRGVNILYWWLAEANGSFEVKDGGRYAIEGMKHVVHTNRVFYHYPEET